MRAVPRRYRFAAARMAAETLRPFVRRSTLFREHRRLGMDTDREVALHHALKSMTSSGTPFDPPMTIVNVGQLDDALAAGRGVFFATTHMVLAPVALRYLHDRGIIAFVVASSPPAIIGTGAHAHDIAPSPESLLQVRSVLREGGALMAMIDLAEPSPRTIEFETAAGTLCIRDTLLRLAQRCGAAIFFVAAHAQSRGGILVTLEMSGADPVAEFVAFVRTHARG
ncbi:MAG TPA: hypothetical protein VGR02_09865 [Thermoanaerobaculia bacterium]|jgi:lauroyl/myristoyl acyltransferase|nr:hypothetical protein [Thermoanaerobaculia bacterium]